MEASQKPCAPPQRSLAPPSTTTQTPTNVNNNIIHTGHGGSEASAYAARALLQKELKEALETAAGADPELPSVGDAADEGERAVWAAQDALIERLPRALHAAFMRADAECKRRFRRGGTTATLAVSCGWELLVASVGDSCAYLDTGREILLVSANHRIDDNADERARIVAAGGERARFCVFCVWGLKEGHMHSFAPFEAAAGPHHRACRCQKRCDSNTHTWKDQY